MHFCWLMSHIKLGHDTCILYLFIYFYLSPPLVSANQWFAGLGHGVEPLNNLAK